jgi:hypothetical protein
MTLLIINRTDSRCGACGKACDPREKRHATILGYGPDNGKPGCGAVWTHATSHYVGLGIEQAARRMRPDLEWIDPLGTA